MMKIRKGDLVEVIAGNDKGRRGVVERVIRGKKKYGRDKGAWDPNEVYVVVEGVNIVKKHQRRTGQVRTQIGILEREAPIHLSKVMLVAPQADSPTRVTFRTLEDGSKVRYSPQFDEILDRV